MKKDGKILGIIAIKGGVGKTTAVINLAATLAHDFQKKVLIVDANFSSPNVGLHLGLVNTGSTIHHVLNDKILVHDAIYRHQFGFDVIPASLVHEKISPLKLKQKISVLKKYYDFILLDSSPSLNEELLATMMTADKLFVVTSPDFTTLSTTLRAVRLAKEKGTPILGLILNKVRGKRFELSIKDIENTAHVPVVAVLREDQKVLEALAKIKPVTLYKPHNRVSVEYRKLAAALADTHYNAPGVLKRMANYVVEDFENFRQHRFKNGLSYYK